MKSKKIAWAGALVLIGIVTTEFGVIGILPELAEYYKVSITTASYLLSAFAMVVAIAGSLVTAFTGNINRKKLMVIGMTIFLLSTIVSVFAPPFWLLVVVRMLPAFIQPTLVSIAVAAATASTEPQNRHRMMSIVIGGIAIATITTIPLTTYIAGLFDRWEVSYIVASFISLLAILGVLTIYPNMESTGKKNLASQIGIFKKPVFVWSSIAAFLAHGTMFTSYSYFANYLNIALHISKLDVGKMLFVFGVAGVLGNFLTGKILGKSVTYTMLFFLGGLTILSFPLVGLQYMQSVYTTYAIVALWGFLHMPCFVNAQAYMIEVVTPEAQEFANSTAISFGNLGIALGTMVSGWFITLYGSSVIPWVMLGFGIATMLSMLVRHSYSKKIAVEIKNS
ncbi:MFS transporter [Myroides odoratimimus]|uniref:MFS transporter n=1 Tax=Myroides odoratimimus TaxID=76832 RepID=UPI0004692F4A|nr:MFS transporter [Myroides odoratimimus]